MRWDLLVSAGIGVVIGWWIVPIIIRIKGERNIKGTPDDKEGVPGSKKGKDAPRISQDDSGQ